jgi:hypothetical protein
MEIRQHLEQALGGDPRRSVVAVRQLGSDDLRWLEERAVRFARAEGYSWAHIGRLLGKSRQAVRQRFVGIDGTVQPLPRRPMADDERTMSTWNAALAGARRRREFLELDPSHVVPW